MVDGPVLKRGVLTAPAQTWDAAAQRAEVIKRLAGRATVDLDAADAAAAELSVTHRQVYALVKRWRAGEGTVSELLPGRSSGGRRTDEVEAITRECHVRGFPAPSRGTVLRRIARRLPTLGLALGDPRPHVQGKIRKYLPL